MQTRPTLSTIAQHSLNHHHCANTHPSSIGKRKLGQMTANRMIPSNLPSRAGERRQEKVQEKEDVRVQQNEGWRGSLYGWVQVGGCLVLRPPGGSRQTSSAGRSNSPFLSTIRPRAPVQALHYLAWHAFSASCPSELRHCHKLSVFPLLRAPRNIASAANCQFSPPSCPFPSWGFPHF